MYIEPNTTIVLYHNIPLDNTYEHTIDFTSKQAQTNYFHPTGQNNIVKRVFNEQTYQRVIKGRMRVEATAEFLYDCNYMSFKNTAFGNKWFYAFVTGVEYVNNVTSEITYEIDPLQTYMFDVTLKECFVEREHSASDEPGDNLVYENLRIDEYIQEPPNRSGLFESNKWGVMVQSPYDNDGNDGANVTRYNRVCSGNTILVFPYRVVGDEYEGYAEDFLGAFLTDALQGKVDGISQISMFPTEFCEWVDPTFADTSDRFKVKNSRIVKYFPSSAFNITRPTSNGGYNPKNKKLLTYPYMYLGMTTGDGTIGEYKYEYFKKNNDGSPKINFAVTCDLNTVTLMCAPVGYNSASEYAINYNYSMTMGDIPMCSYATDTYTIWSSQNKVSYVSSALMGVVSSGVQIASGNVAGGTANLASSILNTIGTYDKINSMPDYVKGNAGSGLGIANQTQDFNTFNVHLKYQNAKIIDDYFTMFGYAVKEVKKPQYRNRPHWNYIKTNGCVLIGNAPSEDVRKICNIFDNGITFWKNPGEVGNYELNNSPT